MTPKLFFTVGADGRAVVTHARPYAELDTEDRAHRMAADVAADYLARWGDDAVIDWFAGQNGFHYLFDSNPVGATDFSRPANRVLAAWGTSNPENRIGDRRLLRRFPLPVRNRSLDRGHLIALASGGGENVNLVPQASRLNRGWSDQGRRWRSLERYCASTAGAFIFVTVLYDDLSDIPSSFLYGIEGPGRPWSIDHFDNLD